MQSQTTPNSTLTALFPPPSPPPSVTAPQRLPGITVKSTDRLLEVLKDNHDKWHIFFNDLGFHNHVSHHLLAIYALGAPPEILSAAYPTHTVYQRPAIPAPAPITNPDEFTAHLTDETFYRSYLKFFTNELLNKGEAKVLEEYVFSKEANFKGAQVEPEMLSRLMGAIIHPLIHAGYGLEFGLPGLVAEGLAQMCLHKPDTSILFPSYFFDSNSKSTVSNAISSLTQFFPSLSLSPSASPASSSPRVTALTVLAHVVADPRLAPPRTHPSFREILDSEKGEILRTHAELWTVNGEDDAEVNEKVEELMWMATIIYGIGAFKARTGEFGGSFTLMHLVTSVLFLPSYLPYLTPTSRSLLLRGYLRVALAYYLGRGRPALPIASFYASSSPIPAPPGPTPTPAPETLLVDKHTAEAKALIITPNPWLGITQSTLVNPNEHLPKLQRSLLHMAQLYGTRPAGYWAKEEGLEGAELLDGTLFVRIAGLTAGQLGWMREGQEKGSWAMDDGPDVEEQLRERAAGPGA